MIRQIFTFSITFYFNIFQSWADGDEIAIREGQEGGIYDIIRFKKYERF